MTTALTTNRLGVPPTVESIPLGGPIGTDTTAVGAGLTSVLGWFDVAAWGTLRAQLSVATFGGTLAVEYSYDDAHAVVIPGVALAAVVAGVPYDSGAITPLAQWARFTYTQAAGGASGAFLFKVLAAPAGAGGGGGGAVTGSVTALALPESKPSPDPSAILGAVAQALRVDPDGRLETRGQVTSDQGAVADDFIDTTGTLLRALTGSAYVLTATPTLVVGVGTAFTTEVRVGDYFELDSDDDPTTPVWARVASITDDTHLTLETAYLGTTGGVGDEEAASVSNWWSLKEDGNNVVVADSKAAINSQTGVGDGTLLVRYVGPLPQRQSWLLGIDNIGSLNGYFGLVDPVNIYTDLPDADFINVARFIFDGNTSETKLVCQTKSEDPSVSQITDCYPFGGLVAEHRYAIWARPGVVKFYVDGVCVATHRDHIPQPYVGLGAVMYAIGNWAP